VTDRQFLEEVRRRARLEGARDAELCSRAVLSLLAGRLSWREQRDLGAPLPARLRRAVLAAANTDLGYSPPDAFLRDLAEELLVSRARAAEIAGAVGEVVAGLLSADELRDLKAELHGTYDVVFQGIRAA
jgi:uncharacterized protein (DUF2267 family)